MVPHVTADTIYDFKDALAGESVCESVQRLLSNDEVISMKQPELMDYFNRSVSLMVNHTMFQEMTNDQQVTIICKAISTAVWLIYQQDDKQLDLAKFN